MLTEKQVRREPDGTEWQIAKIDGAHVDLFRVGPGWVRRATRSYSTVMTWEPVAGHIQNTEETQDA